MNNEDSIIDIPKKVDDNIVGGNPIPQNNNVVSEIPVPQPVMPTNSENTVPTVEEETIAPQPSASVNIFDNQNIQAPSPHPIIQNEPVNNINQNVAQANEIPMEYQNPSNLVTPTPELAAQPVTMASSQPVEPQNDVNNLVTPTPQQPVMPTDNVAPEQGVKLEKKLVVEKPVKKEKESGNPIVGFFALLIILGIIIAAFYYFISQGIIKLPDNIKLPFTQTTTTVPITTEPIVEQEEEEPVVVIPGLYEELEVNVCPNTALALTLNEDKTYTYNNLTFNEADNTCIGNDISGSYTENNNVITLSQTNGEDIVANLSTEEDNIVISIPVNNAIIKLFKVN